MIKSELIQKVATANPHLFHRDVERIINIVLDEITGALGARRSGGAARIWRLHGEASRGAAGTQSAHGGHGLCRGQIRPLLQDRQGAARALEPRRHPLAGAEESPRQCGVSSSSPSSSCRLACADHACRRQSEGGDPHSRSFRRKRAGLRRFKRRCSCFLLGAFALGLVVGGIATWFRQGKWRDGARRGARGARIAPTDRQAERSSRAPGSCTTGHASPWTEPRLEGSPLTARQRQLLHCDRLLAQDWHRVAPGRAPKAAKNLTPESLRCRLRSKSAACGRLPSSRRRPTQAQTMSGWSSSRRARAT